MSYDSIYQIRKTITMAQKLSKKDEEFTYYVGASPEISQTIALLDSVIEAKMIGEESATTLQFFRKFLIRKNKALFASLCSELSKLSFYLGLEDDTINAVETET